MTTHSNILTQLTRYKGGSFSPEITYHDILGYIRPSGCIEVTDDGRSFLEKSFLPVRNVDAHVHIEQQAWKAGRDWCESKQEYGCGLMVRERPNISILKVTGGAGTMIGFQLLGTAPTDADALLAMMKFINGDQA